MKKVERSEILDYVTYEEQRAEIRSNAMKAKDLRRIHLGENLTFLFENIVTVRYQILEMVRAEKMVKEADIQHEIKTYNELIGENGEICCTLLVEIADATERAEKLAKWVGLPEKIYLKFADESKAFAQVDARQNEDEKISSVQFLKFNCGSKKPIAIGCEHEAYKNETELNDTQKIALAEDLSF
ncbi:MAG: DUF3501 family protein [Pyrinomonadaceae bacterium]|nr:DUF3501 family protein [Pyrinomonadaceae bacterium]